MVGVHATLDMIFSGQALYASEVPPAALVRRDVGSGLHSFLTSRLSLCHMTWKPKGSPL